MKARRSTPTAQPVEDLFKGPHSLRYSSETRSFWITLLFAPVTAGAIGALLHSPFRVSEIGIIIVLATVYVTIARGRLLGTSVRVHERQFPEIFAIVNRCCTKLGIRVPQVFVREDFVVPITAMGLGEPYAIVISSEWLRHLDPDELEFLVGCELGHIAAGHTRITSLFSASGRENPLVALVFGAWLRRTEYTADRVGLLCCRSLAAATRAIYATTFRELKGRVDLEAFIEQRQAIEADPSLAMGEWLGETPYAINRLRQLTRFSTTDDFGYRTAEMDRRTASGSSQPAPGARETVFAGFYLRSLAFVVDLIIVGAIVASGNLIGFTASGPVDRTIAELNAEPDAVVIAHWLTAHRDLFSGGAHSIAVIVVLMLYCALTVALVGRTPGMMVFDLRIARRNGGAPGPTLAVWRYLLGFLTIFTAVPWLLGAVTGWWMHERLSGTRLVRGGAPRLDA